MDLDPGMSPLYNVLVWAKEGRKGPPPSRDLEGRPVSPSQVARVIRALSAKTCVRYKLGDNEVCVPLVEEEV